VLEEPDATYSPSTIDLDAISITTGSQAAQIPSICPTGGPVHLGTNTAGSDIYVLCSNSLLIVSPSLNAVVKTIDLPGSATQDMALSSDGTYAYIVNGTSSVAVIDTSTGSKVATVTLPAGAMASYVYMSPDGQNVYVIGEGTLETYVISTLTNQVVTTYEDAPQGFSSFYSDSDNYQIIKLPGNSPSQVSTSTVTATTTTTSVPTTISVSTSIIP
jgi:YVTN family beta-propeller protein